MDFNATALIAQGLNGLVLGTLYILIALGLSLIFGMVGVVNFAHGAFFALGAYFALSLKGFLGFWPTLVLAPLVAGAFGILFELGLLRPLYGKPHLLGFLLTFGLALVVEDLIHVLWGSLGMPFSAPPVLGGTTDLGFVRFSTYRLFVLALTVILILTLWLFLEKTRYGTIIRAGSRDREMVALLGIRLPRIFTAVIGIGTALAGIAGVLAAPMWVVNPAMGTSAIMPAFVVVTVGGLGNFWGAVLGGLLIGEAVSFAVYFWPPISELIMYLLMAVILLLRPRGLLGEIWEEFE